MATLTADLSDSDYVCPRCTSIIAEEHRQRTEKLKEAAKRILVTTTPRVDGYYVAKYIGIESVEFVIGTGMFSEISGSIADFFGSRSSAFENKLQEAKRYAMDALKCIAAEQGANAVIGIDLDYSEFSGNRVALVINGTLVKLAPIKAPSADST